MKTSAPGSASKNASIGRAKRPVRDFNPDRSDSKGTSGRPARDAGFPAFAAEVSRRLNPRGPLETLVVGRVVDAAWRLQTVTEGAGFLDSDPDAGPGVPNPRRITAADRALSALREAVETLDTLQSLGGSAPIDEVPVADRPPVAEAVVDFVDDEVDPAVVDFDPFLDGDSSEWNAPADAEADAPAGVPVWKDRLVFDFEVSDLSPVVKGTWVTVSHVVSLIVDGHSWADILRSHPELTQDDIHACMAYALDELNDPK